MTPMKRIIYICALVICIWSCKQESKESNNETMTEEGTIKADELSLNGTWELVSYYNYLDDEVSDTIKAGSGYRQVKMYTNNKVMWSKMVPKDSTEYFGYGAYTITDSSLTETLEYGSAAMLRIIDTMRVFSFELLLKPKMFSQIQIGPEGGRIYSENYHRIQ